MINILICDDDRAFLRSQEAAVADIMERMHTSCRIHCFPCSGLIPDALLTGCDLAFLDIDFPREDYNGIDIARRLRQMNADAVIIFVTNFVEYAPAGYEVQALRYLLKSEAPGKLELCLRLGLQQLQIRRKTYPIQISGETIHLPIEDILYFESRKHTCVAHVRKNGSVKTYSFYAALRTVEEELEEQGFLRVQKSYLVNMRHIQRYQFREAALTGDIILPVSSKTYAQQKQKYLFWKGRQ